jgi:hypothetical protein
MHLRGSPRLQSKQQDGSPKQEKLQRTTIQASKVPSPKVEEPVPAKF